MWIGFRSAVPIAVVVVPALCQPTLLSPPVCSQFRIPHPVTCSSSVPSQSSVIRLARVSQFRGTWTLQILRLNVKPVLPTAVPEPSRTSRRVHLVALTGRFFGPLN